MILADTSGSVNVSFGKQNTDYLNVNTRSKASPSFPYIHIISRKKEI